MGLSSDLAGAFQIILAQQEAEARKEERHDQTALALLQLDISQGRYEDQLSSTYGAGNIVVDDVTGRPRMKSAEEGFDITLSPDYQMKKEISSIEEDKYLKGIELQGTINMYDRKIEERERVAATLRSEYSGLDDKFISGNFQDVTNAYNDLDSGDLGSMRSSIKKLNQDIAALNALSTNLKGQEAYYKGQEAGYAGLTGIIDPSEFYGPEGMLPEYEEQHPGMPTAGLEKAYIAGLVTPRLREKAMEEQQMTSRQKAQQGWTDLMDVMRTEDFDISNYTEDESLQQEWSEVIQQKDYEAVINNLDAEPTGKLKALFYSINDNIMSAIEGHHKDIGNLRSEFEGIDVARYNSEVEEKFMTELDTVKSKKQAFLLYDRTIKNLSSSQEKRDFFKVVEDKFGGDDLYDAYTAHLNKDVDKDKSPYVTLREGVLENFIPADGKEPSAEAIYEALDRLGPTETEWIDRATWALSDPTVWTGGTPPGLGGFGDLSVDRPDHSAGKAFFGGTLGGLMDTDSPYYDAYYNSMQESLKNLVSEEDPLGEPDWLFYGTAEESHAGNIIKHRYGDIMYSRAHEAADKLGRDAQIKEINQVLKDGSGEDYNDLLKALSMLKEWQ